MLNIDNETPFDVTSFHAFGPFQHSANFQLSDTAQLRAIVKMRDK